MPLRNRLPRLAVSAATGALVLVSSALVAALGGFLNHCRGGYVHFGPTNLTPGTHAYHDWYWPQHILARLLYAIPTGIVLIVFGFHLRGSLVVAMMTWFSLYVNWGTYKNIGTVDNYCSPPGTFDWLIGRQGFNWTTNERFVREYSGASLQGLAWTLPQGYALEQMGFGWEYALTGSVMPLLYYIGAKSNTTHAHAHGTQFMDGTVAISEFMWGMWVWFSLIVACLSQAVRRSRIWVYQRNPSMVGAGFKPPFSTLERVKYESLNRTILRVFYEALVLLLTALFCLSVAYFSLVQQPDIRSKGQTFFGLFTAVLFLVFSQAWMWGVRYKVFLLKRFARRRRGRTLTNNAIYNGGGGGGGRGGGGGEHSPKETEEDADLESAVGTNFLAISEEEMARCEALSSSINALPSASSSSSLAEQNGGSSSNSNNNNCSNSSNSSNSCGSGGGGGGAPVLSWPYSHPDRLSPTNEQRQQVLSVSRRFGGRYPLHGIPSCASFIYVWTFLERYVWMDLFVYARRVVGIISLICTIFSLLITVTAMVVGWDGARFLPSSCMRT